MGADSKISWTDHTANFWWGCVKVSALCDHCYADTLDRRYGESHFGLENRRRFIKSVWNDVPKWNEQAKRAGTRAKVFVMSMGDFFELLPDSHPDSMPMGNARIEAMQLMEFCTDLNFLVLTKRISNVRKLVDPRWLEDWPSHVRLGVSVGTQKDADRDIPRLLELPCPNFLSMEPLLESVDISWALEEYEVGETEPDANGNTCGIYTKAVDWVITGGESGPHARLSHPDWFRLLRDQCQQSDTPFHFKQWGEWVPGEHEAHGTHWDYVCLDKFAMKRVGKKAAGRLLDGKEWNGYPE